MTDEKVREVAIALSQNLIAFHKDFALRHGRQQLAPFVYKEVKMKILERPTYEVERGKGVIK
jgi:hypothetical protein